MRNNRGFGIIIALAFILVVLFSITSCVSFRKKGEPETMTERGQRICEETNGAWVNWTCDYSKSPQADTTLAMLGIQT